MLKFSCVKVAASVIIILTAGCASKSKIIARMPAASVISSSHGAVMVTSAGQSAPVMKLGDKFWIVVNPFTYYVRETSMGITIPKGFITDLASVPRALWSFGLAPHDSYMSAAIVHDYLYWNQGCTKQEADSVLRIAMYESEVGSAARWLVFHGVSLFGGGSFKRNASLKQSGTRRFLTEDYVDELMKRGMPASATMKTLVARAEVENGTLAGDDLNSALKMFCETAVAEARLAGLE